MDDYKQGRGVEFAENLAMKKTGVWFEKRGAFLSGSDYNQMGKMVIRGKYDDLNKFVMIYHANGGISYFEDEMFDLRRELKDGKCNFEFDYWGKKMKPKVHIDEKVKELQRMKKSFSTAEKSSGGLGYSV